MSSHVILSGSNREHPADAAFMGKPSADEILQITLVLRRKDDDPKTPTRRIIASTVRESARCGSRRYRGGGTVRSRTRIQHCSKRSFGSFSYDRWKLFGVGERVWSRR